MAKKPKKSAKAAEQETTPTETGTGPARESEAQVPAPTKGIEDPLGEPADGEGKIYLGDEDALEPSASETEVVEEPEAEDTAELEARAEEEEVDEEAAAEPQKPAGLERLQKILSQAGIASRRKAEELITEGRVQINGQVVTELGTKADPARDHIRVDGKLLHGAERHRYFVLNKPKGYVTTVSDPEGRPTVMTFFEKMRERLYPVGRLDYMSEGLLLVTNDGELANQLTKAGSGVEKTYLVKVAGQPAEDELDKLRGGVAIDRGKPGSGKVHTAPARIRMVRQGDNPWYEVVIIEGRNRELRKMFSSIGHFVEKIRRVGYGPLVLDVEPGKLRELEPEEVEKLRLAAEGKLRTPKPKEPARRVRGESEYTRQPKPSRPKPGERFERREREGRTSESRRSEFRPKKQFGEERPFRGGRAERGEFKPRQEGGFSGRPKPGGRFEDRPFRGKPTAGKPDWKQREDRGPADRRSTDRRPAEGRFDRPRREGAAGRTGRFQRSESERPRFDRPKFEKPRFEKPGFDKPKFDKPKSDRPRFDRPKFDRQSSGRPPRREFGGAPRRGAWDGEEKPRPERRRDDFERPESRSSEQKRRGGSGPGSRPFKPGGQGGSRPSFDSASRPRGASGSRTGPGGPRPQSRGFSKPGNRKTGSQNRGGSGPHRSGPRPGGKRRP